MGEIIGKVWAGKIRRGIREMREGKGGGGLDSAREPGRLGPFLRHGVYDEAFTRTNRRPSDSLSGTYIKNVSNVWRLLQIRVQQNIVTAIVIGGREKRM